MEDDLEEIEEEEGFRSWQPNKRQPTQVKGRQVLHGSFDPKSLTFSLAEMDYPMKATLVPARTRCLCCGGTAGSRNVITPVALGTSAAVKVLSEGMVEALDEANHDREGHDGKERLLIFSDSRQDAAHQARFISFASRYDRMRRRVYEILEKERPLTIQRTVELLGERGVEEGDNPHVPSNANWIPEEARKRIRGWEEAPLLDDISTSAGYRATILNLGLVGIRYHQLNEYVEAVGDSLAAKLEISRPQLEYLCRCLLDELRVRACLSREMLRYNPLHSACPQYVKSAEWERRVKQPQSIAADTSGHPLPYIHLSEVPFGIKVQNAWRKPKAGGRGPGPQRILEHLLACYGGIAPEPQDMVDVLTFLMEGSFLIAAELFGSKERGNYLQVNSETIHLELCAESSRCHCHVCGLVKPFASQGMPCPKCESGSLAIWPDSDVNENRTVRRIRSQQIVPLFAGEHTAQIPHDVRGELEENFKKGADESKVNILACSPTLEMGIDVGGLDAVVLRNVPPRPDNYAQRGGRAGRRSRVGLVVGYARSTPHDQYFYDKPAEMISGEVPAPSISLGNRDVLLRHIQATAFGAAEPGLAGRMVEYINPSGESKQDAVDALIAGVSNQIEHAIEMATKAFGEDVLNLAGFSEESLRKEFERLPERIQRVIDSTAKQVIELRQAIEKYYSDLQGERDMVHAGKLISRLLGIQDKKAGSKNEADDRSAGYPLRRFAEFGLLPGYEFPTEPASLRLLGDSHEEDPISVNRQFGIGQFQPDARVYARRRRWKVIGLDTASPWNPQTDGPTRVYRVCRACELRFDSSHPRCPRCENDDPGNAVPAAEFGGFVACRDENPILDEEDRYATKNLVRVYPQWDGDTVGRWAFENGWNLLLKRNEEVFWLNEGLAPTSKEFDEGSPRLHKEAKGYYLCPSCGKTLQWVSSEGSKGKGRKQPKSASSKQDPYGHQKDCAKRGLPPAPLALATCQKGETLRLLLPVPGSMTDTEVERWGVSLGFSLEIGMRHLHMLGGNEIDFVLEGPWKKRKDSAEYGCVSLTFVDPSLGGTGYLTRIADEFHLAAQRAIEHLDHLNCETACYRCLKSYNNQRYHDALNWPLAFPYLETLAAAPPAEKPLQLGDIDDPAPWLEAYAAGVGSPLEVKFLRLFEENGFSPPKQVPIALHDGGKPITVADFAVPEKRLAIYIDGSAFHVGTNLRRDRFIRQRLRETDPPWRVKELRAVDLGEGKALVERLKQ